jgi:hypothetical protein
MHSHTIKIIWGNTSSYTKRKISQTTVIQNYIKKLSIFLLDSVYIMIKQFLCKHN